MSSRSPGTMPGHQRCQLILQRCVAIQLAKPGNAPDDFWMYDSGYLLFQGFLSANQQCWWIGSLGAACRSLRYAGYVAPGLLLISGDPCALEVVRNAYSRSVLKPPPSYLICGLVIMLATLQVVNTRDIEDCIVTPAYQGHFTPLPEALCDVIMDITSQGQSATMENIRHTLCSKFPQMESPCSEVVYDTLAQLMQERKIYQTSRGYFIVTPERRRSRSHSRSSRRGGGVNAAEHDHDDDLSSTKGILLSTQEALHNLYGEISTIRDGDLTHQCIQTNLADVICGGNPNDKVLYGRGSKRRSASFPAARSLERRGSARLWGGGSTASSTTGLRPHRAASARHLPGPPSRADSSSSTEYPTSVDSTSPKKVSLLSRLFRRSGRSKQGRGSIKSFSAQFPPTEWFNSKAVHLQCVGTQTNSKESLQSHPSYASTFYDGSEISQRSLTLPRHRRHLSTESGLVPQSPSQYSASLPRSTLSNSTTSKTTVMDTFSTTSKNDECKSRDNSTTRNSLRRRDYSHSGNLMSMSGPSSLESNKDNTKTLKKDSKSGPSSIESNSSPKRYTSSQGNSSGHSSLETNYTDRTVRPSASQTSNIQFGSNLSRAQSLVKVQNLQSSPKSLHKNRRPPAITNGDKSSRGSSPRASPKSIPKSMPNTPKKIITSSPIRSKFDSTKRDSPTTGILATSNSNNSITLKVTTNTMTQNGSSTNTKVYVQNSPARSVITFENGKITETTKNVCIINGDKNVKTVPLAEEEKVPANLLKGVMESTTDDEIPKASDEPFSSEEYLANNKPIKVQETKFNKNVINDASMNNNRKLSLQLMNTPSELSYKNQLKNPVETVSNPATPAIHNNILSFDSTANSDPTPTKSFENLVGSIGSMRYYEKNSTNGLMGSQNKLNSNSDLKSVDLLMKAAALHSLNGKSTSQNKINSDFDIGKTPEHKIGSEPNLAFKNQDSQNCILKEINSSIEKLNIVESMDGHKRYSLSHDPKNESELYNFPSLNDLSFNFTSLAAQKILKGVSINSVDTLVELNMAANGNEKQNNCDVTMCTDFGLV